MKEITFFAFKPLTDALEIGGGMKLVDNCCPKLMLNTAVSYNINACKHRADIDIPNTG